MDKSAGDKGRRMSGSVTFTEFISDEPMSMRTKAVVFSDCRSEDKPYEPKIWDAVWDTGSSNTVISRKIVEDLGLTKIGQVTARVLGHSSDCGIYLVNIGLPNRLKVPNLQVIDGDFDKEDFDILIGMDIITLGDLAISHAGNKSVFSFRYPPSECIDFTK